MSAEYRAVSKSEPCASCGATDGWCRRTGDGLVEFCEKQSGGDDWLEDLDKNQKPFWFRSSRPRLAAGPAPSVALKTEPAPVEVRDRVYRKLLDLLSLTDKHRQLLRDRGLTDEQIDRAGYRSLPVRGRKGLAGALVEAFGEEVCASIPGLFHEARDGKTWWALGGAAGILIPCRNVEGKIAALKVRHDDLKPLSGKKPLRYSYVSSRKKSPPGAGPGNQAHRPSLQPGISYDTIRLTEGELKADLATVLGGVLTLSVPGASNWSCALPLLQVLRPKKVLMCFDADFRTNQHVFHALQRASVQLRAESFEVLVEVWDGEKGIDDQLRAGGPTGTIRPEQIQDLVMPPKRSPVEFALTDLGNAELIGELFGDNLRFIPERKRFFWWTGRNWKRDEQDVEAGRCANEAARARQRAAVDIQNLDERKRHLQWALKGESASHNRSAIFMLRQVVASNPDIFDRDNWLFNCLNGTIELRTGTLREHRREDFVTMLSPVTFDPSATCPIWEGAVNRIFSGDAEMIAYVQRVAGYLLTGDVSEECLFVLFGAGRNGKGVLVKTWAEILGPYACKLRIETLLKNKRAPGAASPDLAALIKSRMAYTTEAEKGSELAEADVKDLTGGDIQKARQLYEGEAEFDPTHKLVMSANHKPSIRGRDTGIWSRIHLIPFNVSFETDADTRLKEKLRAEHPGILAWMVRGCLEWRRVGLNKPASIQAATDKYRGDCDNVSAFLADAEWCIRGTGLRSSRKALGAAYLAWCVDTDSTPVRSLPSALLEQGLRSLKIQGERWFEGLGLVDRALEGQGAGQGAASEGQGAAPKKWLNRAEAQELWGSRGSDSEYSSIVLSHEDTTGNPCPQLPPKLNEPHNHAA